MSEQPQQPMDNVQKKTTNLRSLLIIGAISIFAILGLLIAYNSGATAEEVQSAQLNRRLDSVRSRLNLCQDEVHHLEHGHKLSFDKKKELLNTKLSALNMEQNIYKEQNDNQQKQVNDCDENLRAERKRRTGSEIDNVSDDILRLRYEIKSVGARVEAANTTRISDRQRILRIVEAYGRENLELVGKLKKRIREESDKSSINSDSQS